MKSPVDVTLTALYFHDTKHGWAAGHDAAILRTEDGGETWQVAHLAPRDERPLLDILFRDAQNGIAVGAYGTFLESRDGGRSWSARKILNGDPHLNALAAGSGGKQFIAGESGIVLYSGDDGAHWTRLHSPYKGSYFGILAIEKTDVIAFGLRGNVYRSADLGQVWSAISNSSQASLMGAQRWRCRAVFVGHGWDGIVDARDGGRTFTRHRDPAGPVFAVVRFALAQFFDHPASHHHFAEIRKVRIDLLRISFDRLPLCAWLARNLMGAPEKTTADKLRFIGPADRKIDIELRERPGEPIREIALETSEVEFLVTHAECGDLLEVSRRKTGEKHIPQLMPAERTTR